MAYRVFGEVSKLIPMVSERCTPSWASDGTYGGPFIRKPTRHAECDGDDCACRCHR